MPAVNDEMKRRAISCYLKNKRPPKRHAQLKRQLLTISSRMTASDLGMEKKGWNRLASMLMRGTSRATRTDAAI